MPSAGVCTGYVPQTLQSMLPLQMALSAVRIVLLLLGILCTDEGQRKILRLLSSPKRGLSACRTYLGSRRDPAIAQSTAQPSTVTPVPDIEIDITSQEARVFNRGFSRAGAINTAGPDLTPEPESSLQQGCLGGALSERVRQAQRHTCTAASRVTRMGSSSCQKHTQPQPLHSFQSASQKERKEPIFSLGLLLPLPPTTSRNCCGGKQNNSS